MAVMILADVWKTAPFMALLLLAGLQVIPDDVYDAAKVDGANGLRQRFRRITIPLLMPAILVAMIFRTLDALRIFDLPYVLTGGSNGTTTLSLIAHQELTANRLIGYGSALSVLTFIIVMAVSFIYIRTGEATSDRWRRRVDEALVGVVAPGTGVREGEKERGEARAAGAPRPTAQLGPPAAHGDRGGLHLHLLPVPLLLADQRVTEDRLGPLAVRTFSLPSPTLDNYDSIFKNDNFTSALKNSVIVTTVTTILALIVARSPPTPWRLLRFKRKFLILAPILSISTFPAIAIAALIFKLWTDIGLYDTRIGLIIPYLTFALPLAIYILTSFFKEIPKELEEAALVDGATYFQAFRKVVLPLAAPGLVTAGLLTACSSSGTSSCSRSPSPARRTPSRCRCRVANFTGSQKFEVPLGTISAASVVITIPPVLAVIIFQKRIVAGMTAGAVKG